MKPVIGYTLGDQSGIGPEVISAAPASGELPPHRQESGASPGKA